MFRYNINIDLIEDFRNIRKIAVGIYKHEWNFH